MMGPALFAPSTPRTELVQHQNLTDTQILSAAELRAATVRALAEQFEVPAPEPAMAQVIKAPEAPGDQRVVLGS